MPAKKNQSRFAKFRLTTQKSKMVAVVAAFVIVGGGITAYKSFAATAIWTYVPGAINSVLSAGSQTKSGCTATVGSDVNSAKNQIKVAKLACPAYKGSGETLINGPLMASVGGNIVSNQSPSAASAGHRYKACATVKGAGYILIRLVGPDYPGGSTSKGQIVWLNYRKVDTYAKFCTDSLYINKTGGITVSAELATGNLNGGYTTDGTRHSGKTPASSINVSGLTLERVD